MKKKIVSLLGLLFLWLIPLSSGFAQTLNVGDFVAPISFFNQSIGHSAPFSVDFKNSVTQQIYTADLLQGLEGKEITKLKFQLYVDAEIYNTTPVNAKISFYLSNVEDDSFKLEDGKLKWLPVDEEKDLYMQKNVEFNFFEITTEKFETSTANSNIKYYTLEYTLDKPFVYTGKSILLSCRYEADNSAAEGPGRSYLDFCSFPKNVKNMPIRMLCRYDDKAAGSGFSAFAGSFAMTGKKDRAVMQITYQESTSPSNDDDMIVVHTENEGGLAEGMADHNVFKCKALKVVGPIGKEDFGYINDNLMMLKKLDLSEAVLANKTIPDHALEPTSTTSLIEELILPPSLEVIDEAAFAYMVNLQKIDLGKNLKKIKDSAFTDCKKLAKVVFPASLQEIGMYAFKGCSLLNGVELPASLTILGKEAFAKCASLEEIKLPEKITTTGRATFSECTSLKKVWLHKAFEKVEYGAFSSCKALTDLYCDALTPPAVHVKSFGYVNTKSINLYVPAKSLSVYKETKIWQNFNIIAKKEDKPEPTRFVLSYKVEGGYGTLVAKDKAGKEITSGTAIDENSAIIFAVDPEKDYLLDKFLVNGEAKELKDNSFTLNITKATEVVVSFKHRPWNVVYSVKGGKGGAIEAEYAGKALPSGSTIPFGENKTILFKAKPEAHYFVKEWIVNGQKSTKPAENNQWEVVASKDYVVEVVFQREEVYYNVKVSQEGNGGGVILEVEGVRAPLNTKVKENYSIVVSGEPDQGYEMDYWKVNGKKIPITKDNDTYITTVKEDLNIVLYWKRTKSADTLVKDTEFTLMENAGGVSLVRKGQAIGQLSLYSVGGELLLQQYIVEERYTLHLASGCYILTLADGTSRKIVIR